MRRTDQGKEYDKRSLSENLRDLDQAQRRGAKLHLREFAAIYTEPFWMGSLKSKPAGILCIRIQAVNGPEVPVSAAGALVHFVWDGPDKGARITKIQGMTSGTAQYRFTFLIAAGDV